ncbi:MAG: sugar phosphate nucleotidyltransferase [Chthoniobacteraceae bacterium]|nr:sugar phosphate nucleotidyltransferase [Chthoniobacteraceae bacterium]
MKAVLPAAGWGTRFLPISKAVPKEMLPLGAKPVIHYVAEEAALAGCTDILIILNQSKESIRRYFEPDPVFEEILAKAGKTKELAAFRSPAELARFHFLYQPEMRGLGDAVRLAKDFIGDEPFAVLLADTVITGQSPLGHMLQVTAETGRSCVSLEQCPPERVSRYGIAGGVADAASGLYRLDAMEEKPALEAAPRLRDAQGAVLAPHAFAARYVFTPAIFPALEACPPGRNGEIQLTDAMRTLLREQGFYGAPLAGKRLDIGNPQGLLEAAALFC